MRKKGQITLFIILGLVVLGGVGVYVAYENDLLTTEATIEDIEEVPFEFQPVRVFVHECLLQVAQDGLEQMGSQGGFSDLVRNNIVRNSDSTESQAVQFSTDSELYVPFWWHMSSSNQCSGDCQFSMVPGQSLVLREKTGVASIETELNAYVEKNLQGCLAFEDLSGFDVVINGDATAETTITARDIGVKLNWPLEVSRGSSIDIDEFLVRIPLQYERIYSLAKVITELEAEHHFLERHILNLLTAYSGIDEERLPPLADTRFSLGGETTWERAIVNDRIGDVLTSNIQLLQMQGTKNFRTYQFDNTLLDSLYNTGMSIPGSAEYADLEVRFNFIPWWDYYFNIDCGAVCRPETVAADFFGTFGLQNYRFTYDLSVPVEVEIIDPAAFNDEGYRFRFFLEANVRNNDVLDTGYRAIDAISAGATQLCDDNKRNSGTVDIRVIDALTGEGVDGQILHSSYDESCVIGTSSNGAYSGNFPVILGGVLTVTSDGYIDQSIRFDTFAEQGDLVEIELLPQKELNVEVKKLVMDKTASGWILGAVEDMRPDEEATVTLRRKAVLGQSGYSTQADYRISETSTIDVAPGEYEVDISLSYDGVITIPEQSVSGQTIPAINLTEGFIVGTTSINDTIDTYDLGKDTVVFYVLNPDIVDLVDIEMEDLEIIGELETLSQRYKGSLRPEFR